MSKKQVVSQSYAYYLKNDNGMKEMSHVQALNLNVIALSQMTESQLTKHYHDLLRAFHPDKALDEDKHKATLVTARINAAMDAVRAVNGLVQRTYSELRESGYVHPASLTSDEASNLARESGRFVLRESTTLPGKIAVTSPSGQKCIFDEYIFRNPDDFKTKEKIMKTLVDLFTQLPLPLPVIDASNQMTNQFINRVMSAIRKSGYVHGVELTSEEANALVSQSQQVVLRESASFPGQITLHDKNGRKSSLDDVIRLLVNMIKVKNHSQSIFHSLDVDAVVNVLFKRIGIPVRPDMTAPLSVNSSVNTLKKV